MSLFAAEVVDGRLHLRTTLVVVGAQYSVELCFEAALLLQNCYSLRVETSWADAAPTHHDYYRKTSESWFRLWTRDLIPADPPAGDAGSPERYRKLCDAALSAEAHLDSVAAIQHAIVARMKRGGRFGTSHKEGGTNIFWRAGKFVREDFGDFPDLREFTDDAEFLKMLRRFCDGDVTRNAGQEQRSDFDVWKLIWRRMQPS